MLSGTGSDGTLGVRAIKGEGGMVMVQAPESTEHDGMPQSVIATGMVDFILPPSEMPAQLFAYAIRLFGGQSALTWQRTYARTWRTRSTRSVSSCVRRPGHDFSQYKQNTVMRRVGRRMALQQVDNRESYLRFLQNSPAEVAALFNDLLIGVTSFFRDPEAFAALQGEGAPASL